MSNRFQYLVRGTGGILQFNLGGGAPADPHESQGLRLDADGKLYAQLNGQIDHYCEGLPFNLQGRLAVSGAPVARVTQGIPITVTEHVAIGQTLENIAYYDQGLAFTALGALAQTGE